jgi:hypothetical protein
VAQLLDPATNAAVAVNASNNGTNWSAWETYVTGAYKRFMNNGTTPDTNVPGGGTLTAAQTAKQAAACAIGLPDLNPISSSIPIIGTSTAQCLVSKTQLRAIAGGVIIAGGLLITGLGVLILVAQGLGKSGALNKAADVAAVVPGGQPVAAGLAIAGRRTESGGGRRALASREADEREAARKRAAAERRSGGQGASDAAAA